MRESNKEELNKYIKSIDWLELETIRKEDGILIYDFNMGAKLAYCETNGTWYIPSKSDVHQPSDGKRYDAVSCTNLFYRFFHDIEKYSYPYPRMNFLPQLNFTHSHHVNKETGRLELLTTEYDNPYSREIIISPYTPTEQSPYIGCQIQFITKEQLPQPNFYNSNEKVETIASSITWSYLDTVDECGCTLKDYIEMNIDTWLDWLLHYNQDKTRYHAVAITDNKGWVV